MNEIEHIAETAFARLQAGRPVVLVYIVGFQGSTPRHGGSKMLVDSDGQTCGTIGGSLMEAEAVAKAGEVLSNQLSRMMSFDLTSEIAADQGMICGGRADILLDYLAPTPENREFAARWQAAAGQGRQFFLLTRMNTDRIGVLGRAVWLPDNDDFYSTSLTEEDMAALKPELRKVTHTAALPLGNDLVVADRIRRAKTVYCFGAGHVAVPAAHLAALAGFRVVVLDDRPDFASTERFPEAERVIVLNDFNHALDGLEIDGDSFIIIVTRGHQYDRAVLEQSLRTNAGYIGMISSRRKRQAIYEALEAAGVSRERLEWVHSPIGIDIGGETPEEIAVSIVAELIKVRNGKP